MKKIYIILSFTGTYLANAIRIKTNCEFSHTSVSLDKNLKYMYSFGRLNPYNPVIGGFVREYKNKGTFKRFKNTKVQIEELEISDEAFEKIKSEIKFIEKHRKEFKFNIKGIILAGVNIKYVHPYTYYCSEFVKYILKKGEIDITNIPDIVTPEDFKNLKGSKIIYRGYLRDYKIKQK